MEDILDMDKCFMNPLYNSWNAGAEETGQDEEKQYNTAKEEKLCAICRDPIEVEEIAEIKGCGHHYCVTCILRWASYAAGNPWCPQCKQPFSCLFVYRALDGSLRDYMLEESVCLLLRASWFVRQTYDDSSYEDEMDEELEYSSVPPGNRRNSRYVRAGREEARPAGANQNHAGASSGRKSIGRRALRAQKREAAEKAAAPKHQKHLHTLGRKAQQQ